VTVDAAITTAKSAVWIRVTVPLLPRGPTARGQQEFSSRPCGIQYR
jgi:hypothetical protein